MSLLAVTLEHHHFTYGWLNPVMGLAFAAAGSFLGLSASRYARAATSAAGRLRWTLMASLAIGGIGIWMMHFIAMIGFTVTGAYLAYDPALTAASFALAVLAVGVGLFVSGGKRAGWPRLLLGGLMCGAGVAGMHYTGMAAIATGGRVAYDPRLVAASAVIAVVASTVALRFTAVVSRRGTMALAATVMSVAVVGMHYTGMAAVRVEGPPKEAADGISPLVLLLPILVLALIAIIGMVFGVLASPSLDRLEDREDTAAEETRDDLGVFGSGRGVTGGADRIDRPSATVRLVDAGGQ
ncbi:MHYT domain-containing protein [Glycomyces sp. NRRL B-16210]|uniref:MHYT domain-containing protein n=1 Tax=Glycomyces sp. NRRL B-16210 TaxID=1463821 RepID=UPI0006923ABD|nr:MHYT domain-containing protein [Glycomyces sp. NRRL B-16210]